MSLTSHLAWCNNWSHNVVVPGTVRIWHANTYRLESTLNYGLERAWSISCLKGSNNVAIGYDEGSIMIKVSAAFFLLSSLCQDVKNSIHLETNFWWCFSWEITVQCDTWFSALYKYSYFTGLVHLVLLSLAHIIFSSTFTSSPSNIASTSK